MAGRLGGVRRVGLDLLVLTGARAPEQIDPIETAKELGIEVTSGHLAGAAARIFRVGGKARIRVSDQIVTPGRRRMSIAHEIGHYVLGHELPGEGDETSWFATSCEHRDKRQEREAEVVAVEHLMPEPMVKPYCAGTPVDLAAVRAIETRFVVSPVAAALRLVELSPEACAVVYSVGGRVDWMKPSRSFPAFFAKGTELHAGTLAVDAHASGMPASRRGRASAWLGTRQNIGPDTEIVEHALKIGEPGWGGVLSLLWIVRLETSAVGKRQVSDEQGRACR
jgi:hypothetical protein